ILTALDPSSWMQLCREAACVGYEGSPCQSGDVEHIGCFPCSVPASDFADFAKIAVGIRWGEACSEGKCNLSSGSRTIQGDREPEPGREFRGFCKTFLVTSAN